MCERSARMVRTLNTYGADAYHATISPNSSNDLLVEKDHITKAKQFFMASVIIYIEWMWVDEEFLFV